jgi:hypothetical protein
LKAEIRVPFDVKLGSERKQGVHQGSDTSPPVLSILPPEFREAVPVTPLGNRHANGWGRSPTTKLATYRTLEPALLPQEARGSSSEVNQRSLADKGR